MKICYKYDVYHSYDTEQLKNQRHLTARNKKCIILSNYKAFHYYLALKRAAPWMLQEKTPVY